MRENNLKKRATSLFRSLKFFYKPNPEKIFKKVKGIVHVGANTGQEIQLYKDYDLSVVWIEPIPEIFETLKSNLANIPTQIALQALVTDVDNKEYEFHLASNNGASSSILDLNLHADIWPEVIFEKTIKMQSKTLPSLLHDHNIQLSKYDMLVMDTQGSELLVLKGAAPILEHFQFIKTEVPDFESYSGCCQLSDVKLFLEENGYRELSRHKFATHPGGGSYYDIVFKKSGNF